MSRIDTKYCSFCRRHHVDVPKLVSGRGAFICGDCIERAATVVAGGAVTDFAGWDAMDDDELLESLVPAQAIAERAEASVAELIALLRARNVSWARVGAALDVSRQAVWERYASRV
jgi:hypothetical protein